ncbi:hypothetical protein A4A49_64065 [Nicotiana attenuata]|uniref:Uncharacterized protein n=1 Tax=Nicotiana attenuata TaxID=49451 RepID=A0A314KWJ0_NICAT|nr:hypothetical protein A4A49_64065 [Nicotiana attenuata]
MRKGKDNIENGMWTVYAATIDRRTGNPEGSEIKECRLSPTQVDAKEISTQERHNITSKNELQMRETAIPGYKLLPFHYAEGQQIAIGIEEITGDLALTNDGQKGVDDKVASGDLNRANNASKQQGVTLVAA